jgi:protein tyrosine/serine phosphatase
VSTFLEIIDNQARQVNDTAAQNVANKYPHSVFVHCAHGSDRTGCMVGIWRVSRDQWTYPQAYKEMRKCYFGPQFKELSHAVQIRAQ